MANSDNPTCKLGKSPSLHFLHRKRHSSRCICIACSTSLPETESDYRVSPCTLDRKPKMHHKALLGKETVLFSSPFCWCYLTIMQIVSAAVSYEQRLNFYILCQCWKFCTNNVYCTYLSKTDQTDSVILLLGWKHTVMSPGKLIRPERLFQWIVNQKSLSLREEK